MASFSFTVDTRPMANSLDGVSNRVYETTDAVTAMEAAVVAEEREAAEQLCRKVDSGFYSLIQSQLSTKKTEHLSTLRVRFLSLRDLGRSLAAKQARMEQDVARIHREYYRLFHGIDKALDKQVRELDADAYRHAEQRRHLFTNPQMKYIPEAVCSDRESVETAMTAVTAKVRKRTQRALDSIGSYVDQNQAYRTRMQGMLESGPAGASAEVYVPAVIVQEASMVLEGSQVFDVFLPEGLNREAETSVNQTISEKFRDLLQETCSEEERVKVETEFRSMITREGVEPRLASMMMALFEKGGGQ
ncbi:MAG: hypothetical protein IKH56_00620 [Oscillospiraceae bacterium]|nr:hypothetical protein [Oscillospiraceae bacterium]